MTSIFTPSTSFICITLSSYSLYRFARFFYPKRDVIFLFTRLLFHALSPESILSIFLIRATIEHVPFTRYNLSIPTFRPFLRVQPLSCDKKIVSRKSQTLTRTIFKIQLRYFKIFPLFFLHFRFIIFSTLSLFFT